MSIFRSLLFLLCLTASALASAQEEPVSGIEYNIIDNYSNHCFSFVDDPPFSDFRLEDCEMGDAKQSFLFEKMDGRYYRIKTKLSGNCLVPNSSSSPSSILDEDCSVQPEYFLVEFLDSGSGFKIRFKEDKGCVGTWNLPDLGSEMTMVECGYAEEINLTIVPASHQKPSDTQKIIDVQSGKCLDVKDHALGNGASVQLWDCSSESQQAFRPNFLYDFKASYQLRNLNSSKCLTVEGRGFELGSLVVQRDCNAANRSQWFHFPTNWDGSVTIATHTPGICLTIDETNTLVLTYCQSSPKTFWLKAEEPEIPTGELLTLKSMTSMKCLSAGNDGRSLGTTSCSKAGEDPSSSFRLAYEGEGVYSVHLSTGGTCLSAQENKTDNGTPVILWQCHSGPDQKVKLDRVASHRFKFHFLNGKCLDLDGNRLQIWDCNGNTNQVFEMD